MPLCNGVPVPYAVLRMGHALLGRVIKEKYRIDRVLGEGGMGVVVAAHHVALDQRVAIKFLLPEMLTHREIVERFAREARAASKIQSDHVARVTDVDTLEDGTPFMVMEYLEGSDLSSVRREGRPLPVAVAVAYLLQACEAIGEAHRMGIVHRDIKPANLFLARRSGARTRIKVLDFGISKMNVPGGADVGVTRTGFIMGSAEYMSPEQMMSARDVDARCDIWALGVTLYELLTAQAPFQGESVTQLAILVTSHVPPPPSALRGDVPPGLDAVVMRCLEKDRARRYASADELAAALAPFEDSQAVDRDRASIASIAGTRVSAEATPAVQTTVLPVVGPRPQAPRGEGTRVSGVSGDTAAPVSSTPEALRSRPWKPAVAIAGVVLALGGVTVAAMQTKASGDQAPATASRMAAPPASVSEPPTPASAAPATASATPVVTPAPSAEPSAAPSSSPRSTKPSVKPKPKPSAPGSHHSMD
jgi:eukaryotic-like serine/threonine-protein kinase